MPRVRSLGIAIIVVLLALWILTPMARATWLLRDSQHPMGAPPIIAGVQSVDAHFVTSDDSTALTYLSGDNNPVPIAGWLAVVHPQAPTVILLPGWKADRTSMLKYAWFLVRGGLNVLLIDLRGTGHSGGSFSLGLYEPMDVKAAVSYLDSYAGITNHHYGVLGVSFGAGVGLAAAGGNGGAYPGDPEINAIVADSPWATEQPTIDDLNSIDIFGQAIPLPHTSRFFDRTLPPDAEWAIEQTIGGSPNTRSALAGAAHLAPGQSLLIIHSVHDENATTSAADAQELYAAAHVRHKELWLAPRGGHAGAYDAQPQVYEAKVLHFFRRYLVSIKDAPYVPPSMQPDPLNRFQH